MTTREIKIPGSNMTVIPLGSSEEAARQQRIIDGRDRFIKKYMADKDWGTDVIKLAMNQILEIRDQPGWKDPL